LAPAIRDSKVAVVGVGALGSFIADMLVRAGVRHLTLIDGDLVMPGNVVRHLAGVDAVGMPKADAVKQQLTRHNPSLTRDVAIVREPLTTSADAATLVADHHLVVDATADFATTALLHLTAASMGTRILSAVILNEGAACRIDVLPPFDNADPISPSTNASPIKPSIYEAGCGSPISATPPHAVMEAAAVAVGHVIGILANRPLHPAGEVRDLSLVARGLSL
jgi:molybdopterin/thiamine biosynthesis adenylyltransferase